MLLASGCKKPNLIVSFKDVEVKKVVVHTFDTSVSNYPDTLELKNKRVKYFKYIKKPTLFHLIIDGYNDFSHPIDLLLSDKTTSLIFDTLIPYKTKNHLEYYSNLPHLKKDPNNNQVLLEFYRSEAVFFSNIVRNSNSNKNDSLLQIRKELYKEFIEESDSLVIAYSNHIVSAFMVNHLIEGNLLQLNQTQKLFESLSAEVRESVYGLIVKNETGLDYQTTAPLINSIDIKGDTITLDGFPGKLILLHFWSTTCAPCIQDLPRIIELSKQRMDLIIINISFDSKSESWERFVKNSDLINLINICDEAAFNSKIATDYYIKYIPSYYLLDKAKRVIIKGNLSKIEEKLKNNSAQ